MHESYSRCFYTEKVGRRRFGTHDGEGILMIWAGDGRDGAFLNSSLRVVDSSTRVVSDDVSHCRDSESSSIATRANSKHNCREGPRSLGEG